MHWGIKWLLFILYSKPVTPNHSKPKKVQPKLFNFSGQRSQMVQPHRLYLHYYILGDPEVTANIYCKTQPSQYRYALLQYRFEVTSGSPNTNTSVKYEKAKLQMKMQKHVNLYALARIAALKKSIFFPCYLKSKLVFTS